MYQISKFVDVDCIKIIRMFLTFIFPIIFLQINERFIYN